MTFEEYWSKHGIDVVGPGVTASIKRLASNCWNEGVKSARTTAATPQPPPTGDGQEVLPSALESIRNYRKGRGSGIFSDAVSLAQWLCPSRNENTTYGELTEMICCDLVARQEVGIAKYGTPLKTHNGRDALVDAYQESLDLLMYLRQWMMENQEETK
jgi:hypothetical protein